MKRKSLRHLLILICLLFLIPTTVFATSDETNVVQYTNSQISSGEYKEPTRKGYTFAGWFLDEACTAGKEFNPQTEVSKLKKNTDIYPKWVINEYTITYNLDGGTNPSGATTKYTVEQSVTLPTPTKENYEFLGWYEKSDFSGSAVTAISKGIAGDKVYYAQWKLKGYEITLDYNNMFDQNRTVIANTYDELPTPTRDGYEFLGWSADTNITEFTATVQGSMTPVYEELSEGEWGLAINSKLRVAEGNGVLESEPFTLKETSTISLDWKYVLNKDDVLNYKYQILIQDANTGNTKAHIITFNTEPGQDGTPPEGYQHATTTLEAGTYKVKMSSFLAYRSSGNSQAYIKNVKVERSIPQTFTGPLTLTAQWKELPKITLNYDDGMTANQTVKVSSYNQLPTPTREGYVFDGWYTSSKITEATSSFSNGGKTWNKISDEWILGSGTSGASLDDGIMTTPVDMDIFDRSILTSSEFTITNDGSVTFKYQYKETEYSGTLYYDIYNVSTGKYLGTKLYTATTNETCVDTLSKSNTYKTVNINLSKGTYKLIVGFYADGSIFETTYHNNLISVKDIYTITSSKAPSTFTQDQTLIAKWSLVPGLYDSNDNLLATWSQLVNDYKMNIQTNYTNSTYATATTSGYYVLTQYPEFSSAYKLIVGSGVSTIGNYNFYNCSKLKVIELPEGLTTIKLGAFRNAGLKEVKLPQSLTTINTSAFNGCRSLTSITIPSKVTTIATEVFTNCTVLKTATFEDPTHWYVGASSGATDTYVDVSDPTTAATALRTTYKSNYWTKVDERPIITFQIGGDILQAEKGMTWVEWLNSEYNTWTSPSGIKLYITSDNTVSHPNQMETVTLDLTNVKTSDIIQANTYYEFMDNNYGCFTAGTKVLMEDKTLKNIEDVDVGDRVVSYNPATKEFYIANVIKTTEETSSEYYEIVLEDGTILNATGNHPMYTEDGFDCIFGYSTDIECGTLTIDDKILTVDGYKQVISITKKKGKTKVYNIGVATDEELIYGDEETEDDTFVVEGAVAHNHSGGMN